MFEQRVNSDVLTVSTVNSQDQVTQKPLRDSVKQALKNYSELYFSFCELTRCLFG